jgi:O-antigen/teichoic acid export membrane protein
MDHIRDRIKNLLKGNHDLSRVALGDFISNAIGALFWLFIATLLTPEEYGEISYLISIAAIASTLSMVGAYNSIVVLTSKNIKIQSSINFVSSTVGLVASIIVFVTINRIELSLLIFAYIFTNLIIPQIIGKKEFNQYFKYTVFNKILIVASSLILFYLFGYLGIIIGLSMSVFLFGFKIFQTFRIVKINFKLIKTHSRFIFTNYIMNISETFSGSLDKIIIAPILGFAVLGGYQLGLQFFAILIIIPGIVYKITLPDDARGIPNQKLKLVTILISLGLGALSFVLIPIAIPYINSSYNDSILPIQIIAVAVIPGTVALMYWSKFIGTEKNKIILIGSGIQASTLITLIIVLGQNFESLGISIAFLISQSVTMFYFIIVNYFVNVKGSE